MYAAQANCHDGGGPGITSFEAGWNLWMFGLPGNKSTDGAGNIVDAPVSPFRLLNQKDVPENIRRKLASWQRVYRLMEAGDVGTKVAGVTAGVTKSTFLGETFCSTCMHACVHYCAYMYI